MTTEVTPTTEEAVTAVSSSSVGGITPSVEDMAAHDYRNLVPELYKLVDNMPRKHLLRVFKAMIEYPLETQKPNLSFDAEKKAFYYTAKINDCKQVLMKAVMELIKDRAAMEKLKTETDLMLEKETQ